MIAGFRETGAGAVQIQLRNIARKVPENARKVMRRGAEKTAELARSFTPEDTKALVDSIRVESGYQEGSGRLFINVIVANKIITLPSGRTLDLNTYALIIHESYSQMKPGDGTLAKMARSPGVIVGERFMDRAAAKMAPAIEQEMIQVISQTIIGETL